MKRDALTDFPETPPGYGGGADAIGKVIRVMHNLREEIVPIKISPGESFVTGRPSDFYITVLGSCVAACIRDPIARVGGMNHFMLPESSHGCWDGGPPSKRFGNIAMKSLIEAIIAKGGSLNRLEAKLIGGARMFESDFDVGERNCEFAIRFLGEAGVPIVSSDLRGLQARRVHFMPVEGRLWVKSLPREVLDEEGSEDVLWG